MSDDIKFVPSIRIFGDTFAAYIYSQNPDIQGRQRVKVVELFGFPNERPLAKLTILPLGKGKGHAPAADKTITVRVCKLDWTENEPTIFAEQIK